jgi:superfamily II DNA or RNA helicase
VQLPTGAGKTYLAILAMVKVARPTLIIVPTIDLMCQWQEVLGSFFDAEIGTLGGGSKNIQPITIATYDSAVLFVERIGNQFGFLIADECHHLPAPQYQNIALGSIAPFRLGLSATVERADGKESEIYRLLGDMVYEGRIDQMADEILAPYDVINIQVPMNSEEKTKYDDARKIYTDFVKRAGVNFGSPRGWQDFIIRAARLPGGKEAMKAYREQKKMAQGSSAKLIEVWKILLENPEDRIIVFTEDNDMAYKIGRKFILPVLTHKTKMKERKQMLESFRSGTINVIVTSKVLNEGVDVPDARIGIIVSGSGGVREHVQRLGRILRHRPGKRAKLFEIVSKGTSEYYVNQRRRQHHAYKGSPEISS